MKKRTLMRMLSLLLIMTLISTCAISGTFAKYVTKASGEDLARVAKWGILLTIDGDSAFKTEYETHDTTYEGAVSVQSSTEDKVVAPGTSNDPGLTATVFGTPEVATRYTLEISGLEDIFLPAGTYTDYTELVTNDDGEYGYFNTFPTEDYAPVKWNLKVSNSNGTSYDLVTVAAEYGQTFKGFSFTDAESIMQTESIMNKLLPRLEGMASGASNAQVKIDKDDDGNVTKITVSMDFDPNTEMDYTFELIWMWDFDDNGAGTYDKQDTLLGNLMAAELDGITLPVADGADTPDANLWIKATVTATATQID